MKLTVLIGLHEVMSISYEFICQNKYPFKSFIERALPVVLSIRFNITKKLIYSSENSYVKLREFLLSTS